VRSPFLLNCYEKATVCLRNRAKISSQTYFNAQHAQTYIFILVEFVVVRLLLICLKCEAVKSRKIHIKFRFGILITYVLSVFISIDMYETNAMRNIQF